MSSPIGHTLAGVAIPLAFGIYDPVLIGASMLVANIPDWPLKGWGHDEYLVSHSLPLLALLATLAIVIASAFSPHVNAWLALVLFSHIAFDASYKHDLGVPCWWPFSKANLQFLPIFTPMRSADFLDKRNYPAYLSDLIIMGGYILGFMGVRLCVFLLSR